MNLWSKKVPVNISFPIIFNQIDVYLYTSIISSSVKMYYYKGQTNALQKKENK